MSCRIVAFGHRTGVGKDTAAKMLVTLMRLSGKYPRGVKRISFAKPLKDAAYLIWRCYGQMQGEFYEEPGNWAQKDVTLPVINKTPRQLWIDLGTHVRQIHGPSWRDAALAERGDADALVIQDLRFINEAEGVHELGGLCVKVESPRGSWHASDHELKDYAAFDATIHNDSTLDAFNVKVESFATQNGLL